MRSGLPHHHHLSEEVLAVAELLPEVDGIPHLTDIQYGALEAGLAKGNSLLVSAPTSTGKTLVGWWAIASSIKSGGRAIYLVSHRALAKQKFEEAQRLFLKRFLDRDRSAIVCATGDGVEDAMGRTTGAPLAATLLIATYEKFLGCLSTGGPPRDLTDCTIICDEIQLVGDSHRGQNAELLLTLLRKSGWRQFIGLSAVLSNADAQALAEWLGISLLRNPTREKSLRIQCRTDANIAEIVASPGIDGELQVRKIGREESSFAGVLAELLNEERHRPVIVFCMKVDDTYDRARELMGRRTPSEPLAAPSGVELDELLKDCLTRRVAFHNAELSEEERVFVEERIAAQKVDVVFATSTLAAGVNFPLGSAIFNSWQRWNRDRMRSEPISRSEFQNMAGRVGRMGQVGLEGLVVCTASPQEMGPATRLMDIREQDELGSGISPDDFSSLTLQIFAGKLCVSRQEAFDLIASTLSASRELMRNKQGIAGWEARLNAQIDLLIRSDCLIEAGGRISTTAFGIAVARTGLKPETALVMIDGLIKNGEQIATYLPSEKFEGREEDIVFILAHAALGSPEYSHRGGKASRQISWRVSRPNLVKNEYANRLDKNLFYQPWAADVSAANGALLITSWACGDSRKVTESLVPGVRLGITQAMARDVAWILVGIADIISYCTAPTLADESKPAALRGSSAKVRAVRLLARGIRRQASRISSGLPSNVLWMSSLELPGQRRRLTRPQMLALRSAALTRPIDLMNGDQEHDHRRRLALEAVEHPAFANQVRDAARAWKVKNREYGRRNHILRAAKFGATAVIEALYTERGSGLERAFAEALAFVAISCEQLDKKGRIAHPDFMVTVEKFPSIIFEIKTRISEDEFVSLNSAMEVLAASEVMGLKEHFCVTLCSPAVEPSVPGIIEGCGRLCVVDVSDLAEAILRLREGRLDRSEFYNWLTTPGVALIEDLSSLQ